MLKLKSAAPFCATMKSASPVRMMAPEVCFIPSVTTPSATTVVIPTEMPSTVNSVRIRCRNKFLMTSEKNVIAAQHRPQAASPNRGIPRMVLRIDTDPDVASALSQDGAPNRPSRHQHRCGRV